MLDHFGFVVTDLNKAETFYANSLLPLGIQIIERHDYGAFIMARSTKEEFPFLWIGTATPNFWKPAMQAGQSPIHLCFRAPTKESVIQFYEAAINSGGIDNGKPGFRDPGYFAAYVLDPDGNNIEAGFRL